MLQEKRKIQVDSKLEVSSVWAIPDEYRSAIGSAILLAHGAGNDIEHPFLSHSHRVLAEAG
jgi:predicted alpha/beta-hydrolase family hydrolase